MERSEERGQRVVVAALGAYRVVHCTCACLCTGTCFICVMSSTRLLAASGIRGRYYTSTVADEISTKQEFRPSWTKPDSASYAHTCLFTRSFKTTSDTHMGKAQSFNFSRGGGLPHVVSYIVNSHTCLYEFCNMLNM